MEFIKREKLYNAGPMSVNGKSIVKIADLILGEKKCFYHLVFLRRNNYYTLLMDDFETFPTKDLAREALAMLCEVEITGLGEEKINTERIKELLNDIDESKSYYKNGNYIVRTEEKVLPNKKAAFTLCSCVPIDRIKVCISNLNTVLSISVNSENKGKIEKYDKLFNIEADGEIAFKNMLCVKAQPDRDGIVLKMVTEREYFMSHAKVGIVKIAGNLLWSMQAIDYSMNKDREDPIPLKLEDISMNSIKKRYFFIFSIKGLKITNDIRFGLVTFTNESGVGISRENEYKELLSDHIDCFAQIAVVNDSLRLAANEAIGMVEKAVALFDIMMLDDAPRYFFNNKDSYREWDYKTVNLGISMNELFYVEDVVSPNQYAVLSLENSPNHLPAIVDRNLENLLNTDNILEDFFYLLDSKKKDELLQAIFWLNASTRTTDKNSRIIALYNCVEFIVSREKGKTLDQILREDYSSEYDSAIEVINSSIIEIQNDELRDRIKGAINGSLKGNSSVHSKLNLLIENLPISFNEDEWNLFDKLKKNRHNLIHNKKVKEQITNQELNELFHLFSKLIIYRIIQLSNEEII